MFSKYAHMENDYKILKFDNVNSILSDNTIEWVGLEKIHGTNFSFICDGINVFGCRRSEILKPDESFYSYQNILSKYKSNILMLFELINKLICTNTNTSIDSLIQIQLYGELYGGNYKGLLTPPGNKSVQKGIYYSNTNEFAGFDLVLTTRLTKQNFNSKYLDWDIFENLLTKSSIPIVPIIKKGTWDIISKLDPKFESEVYKLHNLPKLESNWAEGYVIKPIKNIYLKEDQERLIWKFKNPSFAEIIKDKSKIKSNNLTKSTKSTNPFEEQIINYVSETRYDNVVSKVVESTPIDEVVKLFYNDIWIDFIDDLETNEIKFEDSHKKECENKLRGLANKFVRTRYTC